jgi:hypothetical protein
VKKLFVLLVCCMAWSAGNSFGELIIADHTVVDKYDSIPQQWIDSVKCMLLTIPGESHGRGYLYGLALVESINADYAINEQWSGTPEAYTSSNLRATRSYRFGTSWFNSCGEEDFYTNSTARNSIQTGLTYTRGNYTGKIAFGFGWCWDMTWHNSVGGTIDPVYNVRWAGSSVDGPQGDLRWGIDAGDSVLTGNSVCLTTYLDAVSGYNTHEPGIMTFYTTGPVDGSANSEGGYQRYLKHEAMRDTVEKYAGHLFDYADILCWENGVEYTSTWDGHTFQNGDPQLASGGTGYDGGDGGCHITHEGCIVLGKAMWWFLARLAGWDGMTVASDTVSVTAVRPNGGTFMEQTACTLSCATSGASIYYTTDNSTPDSLDALYSVPFTITASCTVKARAYLAGKVRSAVTSAAFIITQDETGPTITQAYASGNSAVMVLFNEDVDSATATDPANYGIDHGITINAVTLQGDRQSVVLTVAPALSGSVTYALTVNDVEDAHGNAITAGSQTTFSYGTCAGEWHFDENAGDTARDATGNNNHGVLTGAAWATGFAGSGLSFDGNDTLKITTADFNMDSTNSFTIALWFRAVTFTGNLMLRGQYFYPYALLFSGSTLRSCVRTTTATNYLNGNQTLAADTWYHVVLTYNSADSLRTIYIDGAADTANTTNGHVLSLSTNQRTWIGAGFNGVIDEVRLYNRALSAAEIEALYESMVPVELTAFTAAPLANGVQLSWQTATETNNLGWDIFRRTDRDAVFVRVNAALVPGQGTSALPHAYSYADAGIPAGATFAEYYLEQIDLDGSRSASRVLSVVLNSTPVPGRQLGEDAAQLRITPNPFRGMLCITIGGMEPARVTIADRGGRVVRELHAVQTAVWDGCDHAGHTVPNGVYWAMVVTRRGASVHRLLKVE